MKILARKELQTRRVEAGMTIEELSIEAQVPSATISRAENGRALSIKAAHKLRRYFNVDFTDLFVIERTENHYVDKL